jgi:transposase-like protein
MLGVMERKNNMDKNKCDDCSAEITWGEYKYSMNQFTRPLCQDCQAKERKAKYPPKLAEFLNKQL